MRDVRESSGTSLACNRGDVSGPVLYQQPNGIPVNVPIVKQGDCPNAWVQSGATRADRTGLTESPGGRAGRLRSRQVIVIRIRSDVDVVSARERGREFAARAGFSRGDQAVIAAAICEAARNILVHARLGEIVLRSVADGDRSAIVVIAHDGGPGIADIPRAMEDGYSTSGSPGLGLGGARAVMDDFKIASAVGKGTTLMMRKWHTDA